MFEITNTFINIYGYALNINNTSCDNVIYESML